MEISINEIAQMLGGEVEGNEKNEKVNRLSKIEEAEAGSIAFLSNSKYESHLYTTQASAVIVSRELQLEKPVSPTLIRVKNPYTAFAELLSAYEKMTVVKKSGIEHPSFQHQSASIDKEVYLGAFSYIGENVSIGKGCEIHPHVAIADDTVIGEHTIIYSGAKIYKGSIIGSNCIIHSGVVIGSDGFGFAPQEDNSFKKIPQMGNVILEDNVEVGANSTIDRATMGSTILHNGVKIDNLVQIAHNVEIGEHSVVAAQTGISGSAKIGKYCQVAGQVGITGHLTIADKTIIGPQSGVPKSIKNPGKVWTGSPIMEHRDFLKASIALKNLPHFAERLREVEKKL